MNIQSVFDTQNPFVGFFGYVSEAFLGFSFWDAVDILLLTVIIFLFFRCLNSRRSMYILAGVCICLAVMVPASFFELDALNFISLSFAKYGALVFLVLFTPEFREFFEKIGSGSVIGVMTIRERTKRRRLYSAAIDHICAAVKDLSMNKTGALIVVGKTTRLDEIVQTGVRINADVNSFLIRNLFFNKAPLHDGAIVIEDAKIVAAGCLLPLTRRSDVDSDLGTRHRAAIGMSESSDAVVVVVSEETGSISVAYDCTFRRGFTVETLKQFLSKTVALTVDNNT